MKHFRIITFGLLFFSTNLTFGQAICDTLSTDRVKLFDSYSQKQFRKLKKQKKLDPQIAFEIATYYRQKSDTTYKQWYSLFIDLKFRQYTRRIHFKDKSPRFSDSRLICMFYLAQAYFFIGKYKNAYNWYGRVYKANIPVSCLDYYYEEVKRKLGITE
jgi:hypothetical protein